MSAGKPGTPLTPREREVLLCRCVEELTWTETAARLGITRNTVGNICDSAYNRLGAHGIERACFLLGLRGAHLVAVKREEIAS